jgi:hypothetical protein
MGPMKERPILMSAPMVLATLAGRKTQTRRVIKLPRGYHFDGIKRPAAVLCSLSGQPTGARIVTCPYGVPGDRLWVKERCYEGTHKGGDPWVRYFADGQDQVPEGTRWRSSIHMHRWASRIDLEITDVRVQRLQAISEADARAEGVAPLVFMASGEPEVPDYSAGYEILWNLINGSGSWAAGPWVWALTFRRVEASAALKRQPLTVPDR